MSCRLQIKPTNLTFGYCFLERKFAENIHIMITVMNVNFLLNGFVQKRFYSLPWETIAELLQLFCMNGADDDGAIFQSGQRM